MPLRTPAVLGTLIVTMPLMAASNSAFSYLGVLKAAAVWIVPVASGVFIVAGYAVALRRSR